MTFLSRFFAKHPLDTMSLGELKKSEAQLTRQVKKLEGEEKAAEAAIQVVFAEAASDTAKEKEQYTLRIQSHTNAWQLKHRSLLQAERDLTVIRNIITIKEHERTVGSSNTLSRIRELDPEELESWLAKKTLKTDGSTIQLDEISEITSGHMAGVDAEPVDGETVDSILAQVQSQGMTPDSAREDLLNRITER